MPSARAATRSPLVLIADAHEWFSRALESVLVPGGYGVVKSYTAPSLLQEIAQTEPDALILAIDLPGGEGLNLCRQLRADLVTPSTPIILTQPTPTTRRQTLAALRAGAAELWGQRLDAEELLLRLAAQIRAKADADRAWAEGPARRGARPGAAGRAGRAGAGPRPGAATRPWRAGRSPGTRGRPRAPRRKRSPGCCGKPAAPRTRWDGSGPGNSLFWRPRRAPKRRTSWRSASPARSPAGRDGVSARAWSSWRATTPCPTPLPRNSIPPRCSRTPAPPWPSRRAIRRPDGFGASKTAERGPDPQCVASLRHC